MKIGIAAATSKLGKRIVRETLKLQKNNIVAIARNLEKAKTLFKDFETLEYRYADYGKPETLEKAFKGIDILLFISSMAENNERLKQHKDIVDAAKKSKVSRIVFPAAGGKQKEIDPLAKMYYETEEYIRKSGMNYTLCFNGYYIEPDVRDFPEIIKEGKLVNSCGTGKFAYCTRDELAYAYAHILTEEKKHKNKYYYLNGKAITQYELVAIINKVYGSKLIYEPVSVEKYTKMMIEKYSDHLGYILGMIYKSVHDGKLEGSQTDFKNITGREHIGWEEYFKQSKGKEHLVNL